MRILYVADLRRTSSTYGRYEGLCLPEVEVVPFPTHYICTGANRIENILGHRLYLTPSVFRGNKRLLREVVTRRPDFVWIDKGRWCFPSTLRAIKRLGPRLVHHNTDDINWNGGYSWLHRLGIPHYDFYFTTNRFNVREISQKYGVKTMRAGMGYDRSLHVPAAGYSGVGPDVIFVGHWECHTEHYLSVLVESGLRVGVHGHGWRRARDRRFRDVLPLPQEDYNRRLREARLVLCSLSRRNRNESTGRSFEIPAVNGCMLAESTPEHRFLFRHGKEALLFRDVDEMVALVRTAVADEKYRRSLADAGRVRCLELGLSWQEHMAREWPMCVAHFDAATKSNLGDAPFWVGYRVGDAWND